MAFFGPFWAFFLYFLGDAVAGHLAAKRYFHGKEEGHNWAWQWSRLLVSACSFLAGWDCLRLFAGGFWDPEGAEPPLFAYSIYPLMMVHLVLVPLLAMPNTEFEFNARVLKSHEDGSPKEGETDFERRLRVVVATIGVLLALVGLQTVVQRWRATSETGLHRSFEFGGITTWKLTELEEAHEMGYWVIPEALELVGILYFAIYAVIIGIAIWCNVGKPQYFLIQLLCLAGQGGAAGLGTGPGGAFSYSSNLFEVVSFLGMVYADHCFFAIPGKTPLTDPGSVELES